MSIDSPLIMDNMLLRDDLHSAAKNVSLMLSNTPLPQNSHAHPLVTLQLSNALVRFSPLLMMLEFNDVVNWGRRRICIIIEIT